MVKGSQAELDTHKRMLVPASNIERQPEDVAQLLRGWLTERA